MPRVITFILTLLMGAIIIGCGGDSFPGDPGGTTATNTSSTNGTTNGSTTGDVSKFEGSFDGSFSGSNTTGARFNGAGGADIDDEGNAFFVFDATVGGAPYHREFSGTINAQGAFSGSTHTGEATSGTLTISGATLTAQLVWQKRDAITGRVIYTETESFTLTRQ
jgi:hypothetical protein